jgi:hypothetical protein
MSAGAPMSWDGAQGSQHSPADKSTLLARQPRGTPDGRVCSTPSTAPPCPHHRSARRPLRALRRKAAMPASDTGSSYVGSSASYPR